MYIERKQAPQGNSMRLQHLYKRVFAKALPTDRRTDGRTNQRTDIPSYRDARTHLKMHEIESFMYRNDPEGIQSQE